MGKKILVPCVSNAQFLFEYIYIPEHVPDKNRSAVAISEAYKWGPYVCKQSENFGLIYKEALGPERPAEMRLVRVW